MIFEQIYTLIVGIMQSYGLPGYFLAMILQAVIAPIPSEALLLLGGASFGFFFGGLVGSLGETAGAIFGFYASKKGGKPIARRILGEKVMAFTERWFNTYGGKAVIIGRLVPIVPFDAVSYGAGLTGMKFSVFIIATFIASFPRAFFYSALGGFVASEVAREGFISAFNKIAVIIVGLAITLFVLHNLIMKKMMKEQSLTETIKQFINKVKHKF